MRKIFDFLTKNYKIVLLLYIFIQFSLSTFLPVTFKSDSLRYYHLAEQSLTLHTIYPAPQDIYRDYIVAPLYINFLILILAIYNSKITIVFFNICFNLIQLFFVYKISNKIFNKNSAKMAIVLYVFYLSSLGLILMNLTELMFGCLVLGSIYFYLKEDKISYFLSGIFAGASIGVRPFGWILVIIYIIHFLYKLKTERNRISAFSLAGVTVFILLFGSITNIYFGHFIFTSNNGPVNILIGANEDATGAYNAKVFEKGNIGYIDSAKYKTYSEKEEFWKKQAQGWILAHPIRWISLFPMKLIHMFAWDDFSISRLTNVGGWNLYRVIKTFISTKSLSSELKGVSLLNKILFIILQTYHHIYYFSLLSIFLILLIKKNKSFLFNEGIIIIILFILLGLFINLLTFGDARFKYPYIIMMIILISSHVSNFIESNNFNFYKGNTIHNV